MSIPDIKQSKEPDISSDKKYLHAINCLPKFGPTRINKLLSYFVSPKNIWKANLNELLKSGLEKKIAEEFIDIKKRINPDQNWENLLNKNIGVVTITDKNYPKLLLEIPTPPPIIYFKGNLDLCRKNSLAVVGSRKCTFYSKQVINRIIGEVAKECQHMVITSGLALGVDTLAHQKTLETSAKTIAVLGSGLDKKTIYPTQNQNLADEIVNSGGLLLSEFPPEAPALKQNFPQRNRIISGLSLGTLVVEAKARSGALITANYALEQNREVMAVPGNIFSPTSNGPNKLIGMGAKAVTSADDVIDCLNLTKKEKSAINNKQQSNLSETEKIIINCLSHEPTHTNDLAKKVQLNTSTINSILSLLEIKGEIKNVGGMRYIRL